MCVVHAVPELRGTKSWYVPGTTHRILCGDGFRFPINPIVNKNLGINHFSDMVITESVVTFVHRRVWTCTVHDYCWIISKQL
jgi:hypothetical protein